MTIQRENRIGPLIGGFFGGALGYLAGALWNPLAAVILFFLGAYVGYDFNAAAGFFAKATVTLVRVTRATLKESTEAVRELGQLYRKNLGIAIPWTITTLIAFNLLVGGSHSANPHLGYIFQTDVSLLQVNVESVPYTLDILQGVVTGESRYSTTPMLLQDLPRVNALLAVVIGGVFAVVSGFGLLMFVLLVAGCAIFPFLWFFSALRVWKQWPLTVAWALFWMLALPTFGLAWVIAAALTGMYTVRRVACGFVTVGTGIGYLWLMPIPSTTELVGLAAIGCGLTCGLASYGVFALVGMPAVMRRLTAVRDKTISSFSPLPELPWWTKFDDKKVTSSE